MTVAVVGVGGIGANTARMLARMPLKKMILVDRDLVGRETLERTTLFGAADVGEFKAVAAKKILEKKSRAEIRAVATHLSASNVGLLEEAGLILDCTDNWETRMLLNDYCLETRKPWIFCSAIRNEAMLSTIIPEKTPCFACWNPKPRKPRSCAEEGITREAAEFAARKQVGEAKRLLGKGKPRFAGKLFYADLGDRLTAVTDLRSRRSCRACAGEKIFLERKAKPEATVICGSNELLFTGCFKPQPLSRIFSRVKRLAFLKPGTTPAAVWVAWGKGRLAVFASGMVLTKGLSKREAAKAIGFLKARL